MKGTSGGVPAWLVFVVAVAIVLAAYYLWVGVQNYLRTGGLGVVEATRQAELIVTATADRVQGVPTRTPVPTFTPIPACQDFVVTVPSAIVREQPSANAAIVTSLAAGESVCVLGREGSTEWYTIDSNPRTRLLELVYMHETVIEAVNPTPTPSLTPTPLPTVTPQPSATPTLSPEPQPTRTLDPDATDTPTPTPTPTPTEALQSA
jgi:hypothetical protein